MSGQRIVVRDAESVKIVKEGRWYVVYVCEIPRKKFVNKDFAEAYALDSALEDFRDSISPFGLPKQPKNQPIIHCVTNGKTYRNSAEAAEDLGFNKRLFSKNVSRRHTKYCGYKFSYA